MFKKLVYLALMDVTRELSGASYERAKVMVESATGIQTNKHEILFPQAAECWGTATHFGMYDSLHGGNMLYSGQLDAHVNIDMGDTVTFAVGKFQINEDIDLGSDKLKPLPPKDEPFGGVELEAKAQRARRALAAARNVK